jgi:hypothetical protein
MDLTNNSKMSFFRGSLDLNSHYVQSEIPSVLIIPRSSLLPALELLRKLLLLACLFLHFGEMLEVMLVIVLILAFGLLRSGRGRLWEGKLAPTSWQQAHNAF